MPKLNLGYQSLSSSESLSESQSNSNCPKPKLGVLSSDVMEKLGNTFYSSKLAELYFLVSVALWYVSLQTCVPITHLGTL